MKDFFYHAPGTLREAVALLGPSVRPLAGGTDLLTLMKPRLAQPAHLVSIRRLLPRGVSEDAEGVSLGAATTLAELEAHPLLASRYRALGQAAGLAASPQIRNMATLGGNLLQRPRCWYFRHPQVRCWLKGGEACPAREGENRQHALFGASPCVAVHPSDPAAALLAFDAEILIATPQGERSVALADFFAEPEAGRRTEHRLEDNAVIAAVRIPRSPHAARSVYLKAMDRGAFAFALAGVAAVLGMADGKIAHARVVLSGVAPIPWRAHAAEEALLGTEPHPETLDKAAQAAVQDAQPLAKNGYKVPLARALVKRALGALAA